MMLGGTSEIERYSDTLDDVSDLEVTGTMMEDLLEGGQINGEQLAVPLNVEGFGWMYNKEIFNQAGIDPNAIQNYDDFVAAV
ncbi:carbohydrate ABC transporter substrate-binding protein, partial [Salmonella enterica subsp. enterica serovar Enteritidis]